MNYQISYTVDSGNTSVFSVQNKKWSYSVSGDSCMYRTIERYYKDGLTEFLEECLLLEPSEAYYVSEQIKSWQIQVFNAAKNHVED